MAPETLRTQFGAAELARLHELAVLDATIMVDEVSSPAARARLSEVEVLVTSWGCPQLDKDLLDAAPCLRAVFHAAGSVRGVVRRAVFERGILVTNAAGVNAEPVALYTVAAVLWAFKKVPFLAQDARRLRGDHSYLERHGVLGGRDRTVVIVGFSQIGRRVVSQLRTLYDGPILVVDPYADPAEVIAARARPAELAEALPQAEVLSLHAPALPATRHMIGEAELAALPPHATLINTARGSLVDTAALERACSSGRVDAILDVTEPEPLPPDSPLYDLPNVLITPHIAGSQGVETRKMAQAALTELERYGSGLPPLSPITLQNLAVQA
jgi:phosphoglycerate dehydrogenase-like enzyme